MNCTLYGVFFCSQLSLIKKKESFILGCITNWHDLVLRMLKSSDGPYCNTRNGTNERLLSDKKHSNLN